VNFKITGGEPLVRKNCANFIAMLKAEPCIARVTLTTNGLLLDDHLDALCSAGIDGINISLNTLRDHEYNKLTGGSVNVKETVLRTLGQCVERGIKVKINAVLLAQTFEGIGELALLARDMPVDVRFIEVMPIGEAAPLAAVEGVSMTAALERLRTLLPDLHPTGEKRGNGPAQYFAACGLRGRIGFIGAMTQGFCTDCNRVRLTATGMLKPCLCYRDGEDLRSPLRNGCTDGELCEIMRNCIEKKPQAHCLAIPEKTTERMSMSQIGG
jgi:cyclic pyranopterin phosphate synthase